MIKKLYKYKFFETFELKITKKLFQMSEIELEEQSRLRVASPAQSRPSDCSKKKFGNQSQIEKGYRAEDFQTRIQILRNLKIPLSTENTHIIRSRLDGWGYQTGRYDEKFCKKIPKVQYKKTIHEANDILFAAYMTIKNDSKTPKNEILNILMMIGILISVLAFMLFEYIVFQGIDKLWCVFLIAGLFLVPIGLSLVICSMSFFIKRKEKTSEKKIFEKLIKLFRKKNLIYKDMGYQWVIPEKFFWLELRKIPNNIY